MNTRSVEHKRLDNLIGGGIVTIFIVFMICNPTGQAPPPDPPMLIAAGEGDVPSIKWFLDHGTDIEETSHDKRTALIVAAQGGRQNTFDFLLSQGANIAHTACRGLSVLDAAVIRGDLVWVKYVISKGAAKQFQNVSYILDEESPMGRAARRGDVKMIRLLCEAGIRSDLTDGQGRKPISLATQESTIALLKELTLKEKRRR